MLNDLTAIPVSLPPMLAEMAGFDRITSRYIAISYCGSKATWTDGRSSATFSFYTVYEPLINHMALACYLWKYHLGSDDEYPTHSLLCDRVENKLYIGQVKAVDEILNSQHPPAKPMSQSDWEQAKKLIEAMPSPSFEDLRQMGMFEMFGKTSEKQQQQKAELTRWLDAQITDLRALIARYVAAAKEGDYNAVCILRALRRRIAASVNAANVTDES